MATSKKAPALSVTVDFTEKQLRDIAELTVSRFTKCYDEDVQLAAGIVETELVDAVLNSEKFRKAITDEVHSLIHYSDAIYNFEYAAYDNLRNEFEKLGDAVEYMERIMVEEPDEKVVRGKWLNDTISTLETYGYSVAKK